ncbi:ATP-binding protein [Gandjariella thermophila]|uniref:LuxR family transcriptional regulator n=1 Tax=Gandjariella thermophila TaxID=1931992 RepID=A0A4D4J158_9PSEU|nr:LuxR C-terminal-related transcriptional regulator [Gandjariella thermophila]GDY28880.1 LuxR family transcriptional regulator [Gandjariella thermophila]
MRTEPRSAGTLPIELTSFVGRRREVAEATRLLPAARLLTVVGFGGVGKTRLAIQVAAKVGRAFPDGRWFVALDSVGDPTLVPETVASALGLHDQAVDPTTRLTEFLADKQALLVLDNCEHLAQACADLVGHLLAHAPGLRILATSRRLLHTPGEQSLAVPPLPVPSAEGDSGGAEAVTLFAERAAAVVPGFRVDGGNRRAVTEICRRLDGIPLAIELAAVRLRSMALPELLTHLEDALQLPAGDLGGVAPRQATLGAVIDWSYWLCSPAERLLWARVSVFSGGFDLVAAEQVCAGEGVDRDSVLDLVAALLDESILTRHETAGGRHVRYRMLDVIRRYGRSVLAESGWLDTALARHVAWCRRLVRECDAAWFGPGQVDWLLRLRGEHANLRAALETCLSGPGDPTAALEITGALRGYWIGCGLLREGRVWLGRALAAAPEPTPARAAALFAAGYLAAMAGEPGTARARFEEAAPLAERFGERGLLAEIRRGLALVAFQRGDHPTALAATDDVLAGQRAAGDLAGLSNSLFQRALIGAFLRDRGAVRPAEECVAICDRRGAGWSGAYARWVLGLARFEAGDPGGAKEPLRRAIPLLRELDDTMGIAQCLETLAWCAAAEGRAEQAARLVGAARTVYRASGARLSEATQSHHAQVDEYQARLRRALGPRSYRTIVAEGESFDLDQAIDDALERGRPAATPAPTEPAPAGGPLTAREREIAQLVSEGLSNRAIAQRLLIAPRTAETHVENILTKLGFTSRAQVAAWVAANHSGASPSPLRTVCDPGRVRMPVRKHTHRHR